MASSSSSKDSNSTFSALIDACPGCEEEKRIVEGIMGSVAVTDGSVCVPKCPKHATAAAAVQSRRQLEGSPQGVQ